MGSFFSVFSLGDVFCLFLFFHLFLLPVLALAVDESTTWMSAKISREESPLGESGKVIMGEVGLDDFFLLLLALIVPITPSGEWEPNGVVVIWPGHGKSGIFSYRVPDHVYIRSK